MDAEMGRKRPAMEPSRRRDSRVYRRLAAFTRALGGRGVTHHAIHHWVTAGLLPKAVTTRVGFGGRVHTDIPRETECQLLALCRYRIDDKLGRYDLVGAQLWLDGYDVPTRYVRDALAREFLNTAVEVATSGLDRSDERLLADEDQDRLPALIARQRPIVVALPGLDFTRRSELVDELRAIAFDGAAPLQYGIDQIAALTGEDEGTVRRLIAAIPTITRASVTAAVDVVDDEMIQARAAFQALEARVTPDRHRSGRIRAKVRLGQFLFALMQDQVFRHPR